MAFAVVFMSFFVDTNVANAADSLHYSSAMAVAYNTSVDGNEFLYEGYCMIDFDNKDRINFYGNTVTVVDIPENGPVDNGN